MNDQLHTWHIHILGQVQGVGFRPFVYRKAKEKNLTGWVNNGLDGVHVRFNSSRDVAERLLNDFIRDSPPLAIITHTSLHRIDTEPFLEFRIVESTHEGTPNVLLTPDVAICQDCQADINQDHDRRSNYAFTTCTHCGPRYSIVNKLPYDREYTTMHTFGMCPECLEEYKDPENRRYFSQTNSCPKCTIHLWLIDAKNKKEVSTGTKAIGDVVTRWKMGEIVAIKGIGGFLLTCDASNPEVIEKLRARKHRPSKPLALMLYSKNRDSGIQNLSGSEQALLTSQAAPIVLVNNNSLDLPTDVVELIAPQLGHIGVMISYTPLYALLLDLFEKPIVATSGNISNAPIVYKNDDALESLSEIADSFLLNDRDITTPQDDSVIKLTPFRKDKIVIRRSRGFAPTYLNQELTIPKECVLAFGAQLKSTFSFTHQANMYISQYLGDLEDYDTISSFKTTLNHHFEIFGLNPTILLADMHQDYASTKIAEKNSLEREIPIKYIQHHEAHFTAVMAENYLLNSDSPIMGFIWDGTGLGKDGQIWGGEIFLYENQTISRWNHLDYFPFILGDKMPREPRISALSACWSQPEADLILKEKFDSNEWKFYTTLLSSQPKLKTSSMGRLFDAVASILGILDKQTYEGEAAMILEDEARKYLNEHDRNSISSHFPIAEDRYKTPVKFITKAMLLGMLQNESKGKLCALFHILLVEFIKESMVKCRVKRAVFNGGTFQNGMLVDLLQEELGNDFSLYFHKQLSPNDENISFGQVVHHLYIKPGEIES